MKNKIAAKLLPILFGVELLAIFITDLFYLDVMKTWVFNIGIIVLLLTFLINREIGKGRFIGYIALLVIIPILFVYNLPFTTYEGGKAIVENDIVDDEVRFIDTEYKLIPTTPLKSWFIDDHYYHYEVEVSGEKYFYTVSPVNGDAIQLEEDFFKHYR